MKNKQNRRTFLKTSALAGIGLGASTSYLNAASWSKVIGANDKINIGVVGCRNHGSWAHLEDSYVNFPNVNVIAICDPDAASIDRGSRIMYDKGVSPAKGYKDIRKMLENKDIDAISVATPNHWHALATVWGCQAGKDVCVEKPVSHNIWEGRKMVEAAAKYNRVVQADHDMRSNTKIEAAVKYIQSGALGKIEFCHSWVYKRRESIGNVRKSGGYIPRTADYDLYCGPAPMGSLPRKNLHYDWHWQWDFGCGEIGNNGPHHLDLSRYRFPLLDQWLGHVRPISPRAATRSRCTQTSREGFRHHSRAGRGGKPLPSPSLSRQPRLRRPRDHRRERSIR